MYLPLSTYFTRFLRAFCLLFLTLSLMSLSGCGGTKVYNADKTLLIGDNVYNLSNVLAYGTKSEAIISDTEALDVKGMEKKAISHSGPSVAFVVFSLDGRAGRLSINHKF